MSVIDGQQVNASVTNAAFLSRTANTSASGIIQLLNDGSPAISNLQSAVNASTSRERALQTIAASGAISTTQSGIDLIPIASSGGGVAPAAVLFGAGPFSGGHEVTLIGTSDTDFITIQNSDVDDGVILNGEIQLKRFTMITLKWVSNLDRWVELCRNI
jgi:hypothetical protein